MQLIDDKELYQIIGNNIKFFRKKAGLTQIQLSEQVQISLSYLVLLSCSFSLPVLGNQLLLLSDAVDWFLTPTARRFSKGSNHSLFVTLLIS